MKSIVITTESSPHHEWLAFSSWYSIHRNSPDTKVGVIFPRVDKSHQFNWLRKCQVPFLAYSGKQEDAVNALTERFLKCEPIAVIPDTIMMIRSDGFNDISSDTCWVLANSDEIASFVDISRIGKFNLEEWVKNEKGHPFHKTTQIASRTKTVNEQRVVALWRQMGGTFDFINRP